MRGFVGRINYRDAVLANLNALLLCYPPKRQFADDFPALKAVMRGHFESGVSAASSALQIAEKIIENFLTQLNDAEKAAVLGALIEEGGPGFAEIAGRRVKGERDDPRERLRFVTRLTGVALFMAGRLSEEGAIARRDVEEFAARLAALIGADAVGGNALSAAFRST